MLLMMPLTLAGPSGFMLLMMTLVHSSPSGFMLLPMSDCRRTLAWQHIGYMQTNDEVREAIGRVLPMAE